ncbi:hypothetical protein BN903_110 [Halorubrum sp. AJ67]|nr:hypothetical protein BN903_110 [Halorubrum sp. AJ67]
MRDRQRRRRDLAVDDRPAVGPDRVRHVAVVHQAPDRVRKADATVAVPLGAHPVPRRGRRDAERRARFVRYRRVDVEVVRALEHPGIDRLVEEELGRAGRVGEVVGLELAFPPVVAAGHVHRGRDRRDAEERRLDRRGDGSRPPERVRPEVRALVTAGDDRVRVGDEFAEARDDAVDGSPADHVAQVVLVDGDVVGEEAADRGLVVGRGDHGHRVLLRKRVVERSESGGVDAVVVGQQDPVDAHTRFTGESGKSPPSTGGGCREARAVPYRTERHTYRRAERPVWDSGTPPRRSRRSPTARNGPTRRSANSATRSTRRRRQ